jgi:hypothetical protein
MENAVQKRIVVKRFRRRQARCGHCAQILPAIEAMQGSANRQAEPFLILARKNLRPFRNDSAPSAQAHRLAGKRQSAVLYFFCRAYMTAKNRQILQMTEKGTEKRKQNEQNPQELAVASHPAGARGALRGNLVSAPLPFRPCRRFCDAGRERDHRDGHGDVDCV